MSFRIENYRKGKCNSIGWANIFASDIINSLETNTHQTNCTFVQLTMIELWWADKRTWQVLKSIILLSYSISIPIQILTRFFVRFIKNIRHICANWRWKMERWNKMATHSSAYSAKRSRSYRSCWKILPKIWSSFWKIHKRIGRSAIHLYGICRTISILV